MKILRRASLLYRLLMLLPVWLSPYSLYAVRIGNNTRDYVEIKKREDGLHVWFLFALVALMLFADEISEFVTSKLLGL